MFCSLLHSGSIVRLSAVGIIRMLGSQYYVVGWVIPTWRRTRKKLSLLRISFDRQVGALEAADISRAVTGVGSFTLESLGCPVGRVRTILPSPNFAKRVCRKRSSRANGELLRDFRMAIPR
ncbi:uncharacterized protein BO80DRAFT_261891 [Aspergillus ibericus CBS 121593]|uniref:Uncharacterized protein n=1 Tax=Aspergillus ibericus CBS 121593 TaxID=1448316 RepID=A0A395GJ88_9EURO|nr:hypothetical protein BO80DRAFT_261891 [Aspergillus ibericus CBS 121593]RAK95519.1 hypothetical protein BO80DRAFT_261891 [Aspergillus ibericus CBS 121593]